VCTSLKRYFEDSIFYSLFIFHALNSSLGLASRNTGRYKAQDQNALSEDY